MKKLILLLSAALLTAAAAVSCVKYDDSELRSELSSLSDRVKTLEDQMSDANSNISSLWDIVNSLKNKEMVSAVSESDDAWTIKFANGKVITISKVASPVVGVKADSDGVYYWTMDGEWLLDDKGNRMPVSGKDGIAPRLKIEDGWWMVSTDGGATWMQIAKADGISGDGIKDVTCDDGYVYITFGDGYTIALPKIDVADVLKKIQSIQYVPDYDDGKITVNSALVSHGTDAMLFDQPTEITYQFLPAQYAGAVATQIRELCRNHKLNGMLLEVLYFLANKEYPDNIEDVEGADVRDVIKECGLEDCLVAWFDVRKVNTRAGGDGKDVKYCMHILDVVSADSNSGEVTFKVLRINIASESFAAGGLKPRYDVGMTSKDGTYIQGWDPDASVFTGCSGIFRAEDPLNPSSTYSFPVWTLSDLQAWQNRSAFAAQLRLYHFHNYLSEGKDENNKPVYSDFEDELASPYTTLYPNVLEPIELLPGAYVTGPDGNPVPVDAGGEYQYLPYDVLRESGTSAEPGYRVILDGAMPAFNIDGKIVSAADAYKMGYMVYGSGIQWEEFSYSSESLEDLVVGTGQVYAEVEMNHNKSSAERKAAIGGKITGKYTLFTPFGNMSCSGTVEITDGSGSSGSDPDAGYNFLHLKYYTFNSKQEGQTMQKHDFDTNDGSVEWWTRCYPSYYTTLPDEAGTTLANDSRISFRHALADYSPAPINLAELSFNVVDADDNILDEDAITKAGLEVRFEFTDGSLGEKSLPAASMISDGVQYYKDLWTGNTTFLYRTNEMPFIPITARLFKHTGSSTVELPTRFSTPKASVNYPSEMLDYSSFAIVPWVPFDGLESDDFRVVLDEHKVYRIPLGQNLELQDQRPNGVSYYVIKDGEWVIGNVASFNPMEGTYQPDGNGYIAGVSAKNAYHLGDLVFDIESVKAAIPADFRRLVSIVYSTNGLDFFDTPVDGATPYLSFDYTSQITFNGRIEIPVHVELPNPWQPTLETDYTIYIVGADSSSGTGTTKTADDWTGTWSVLSGDGSTPAGTYDNWTITQTPDGDLRISGVTGFTDSEHDVVASVNADGDMVINVQYTGVTDDKTRGELRLLLSGQYTNVEGKTFYSITEGAPILIGHPSDDGDSAYLDPQTVTSSGAQASFYNIRFFGRYQEATGGWSAITWNGLLSSLPQTITRVK